MSTSPRKVTSIITVLCLTGASAWAGNASIEGNVLDQKGQPLKGADVRIERSGGSAWNQATKTDGRGFYTVGNLEAGQNYRVTLLVHNQVKASINNVKTRATPPVSMNFDLSKDKLSPSGSSTAATKKKMHKVWVPSETGSNLGGRWVDEEEGGNDVSVNNVKKASGDSIRGLQMGGR
jgi:hypothetical protein